MKLYAAVKWRRLDWFETSRDRILGTRLTQAKMRPYMRGTYAGNRELMIGAVVERISSRQIKYDCAAAQKTDDATSFQPQG